MASKSTARPAKKSGALCNGPLRSLIVPLRIADQRSGASSSKDEAIIVDDENPGVWRFPARPRRVRAGSTAYYVTHSKDD